MQRVRLYIERENMKVLVIVLRKELAISEK